MLKNIQEAKEAIIDALGEDKPEDIIHHEDLLSELADNNVDIYTSDLMDWMNKHWENRTAVEDTISEFGWDGVEESLEKAIMYAQYRENRELLYEAWEELRE